MTSYRTLRARCPRLSQSRIDAAAPPVVGSLCRNAAGAIFRVAQSSANATMRGGQLICHLAKANPDCPGTALAGIAMIANCRS